MKFRLPVLLAGSLCLALPGLQAQFIWTGAGATNLIIDSLNWQDSLVPPGLGLGADNVAFGDITGSQQNIVIPVSMALNDVVFGGSERPGYTFDGLGLTPTLLLNGKVTVGAGNDVRFHDGLHLSLAAGERVVDIASGVELRVDGSVDGLGTLVKTGAGTLELRGDVAHTGGTLIREGLVNVHGGSHGWAESNLLVGSEGGSTAGLLLTGSARGVSSDAYVGQVAGSYSGMALIDSSWVNHGNFTVGDVDGSFGVLAVLGADASLDARGSNLVLGNAGNGSAVLLDGGRITVDQGTGSVTLGATISGVGELYIGSIPNLANLPAVDGAGQELADIAGTGGILNAAEVTTGSGSGLITFNTVSSSTSPYYFTKDGTATGGAVKITGATVVSNSSGYTILTASNTYTGDTVITGGTLAIGANDVLPAMGDVFVSAAANNTTATLDLRGFSQAIGTLTIQGATDSTNEIVLGSGGSGSLRLNGNVFVFTGAAPAGAAISGGQLDLGGARTFDVGDSAHAPADLTIRSTIVGANSVLLKTGPGTLVLTGANTYNGDTTVAGGKLIAANASALGTGTLVINGGEIALTQGIVLSNPISLVGGGRLGGNGTFGASVTIGHDISLSPGESAGTTTFTNALTWAPGGSYDFEIVSAHGAPGTGYDTIVIAGAGFGITASANGQFNLNLISLGSNSTPGDVFDFDAATSYSWLIASSANPISGFSAEAFAIDTSGFTNSLGNGVFSVALDGSNTSLYLNFTPIPEPSTYALMAAGALVLFVAGRRRKA